MDPITTIRDYLAADITGETDLDIARRISVLGEILGDELRRDIADTRTTLVAALRSRGHSLAKIGAMTALSTTRVAQIAAGDSANAAARRAAKQARGHTDDPS